MKTPTEVYENICEALDVTLVFASLQEANVIVDTLKDIDMPCLVVWPFEMTDDKEPDTTKPKSETPFNAWMLTRLNDITPETPKLILQKNAIEPMLTKARVFMRNLDASEIIRKTDDSKGIGKVVYKPLFSELDAGLHGVSIETVLPLRPTKEQVCPV